MTEVSHRSVTVKRVGISAFVVLNLLTVLFANVPPSLSSATNAGLEEHLSPTVLYRLRYGGWLLQRYAHLVGLDNRWMMFGRQSRFNWSYVITAHYAGSPPVVLPLPFQSERTFWQRTLFDFKEAKFHLNMYPSDEARRTYARYLCGEFSRPGDAAIRRITFEMRYQPILPPEEAVLRGTHLDQPPRTTLLNSVLCPPVEGVS